MKLVTQSITILLAMGTMILINSTSLSGYMIPLLGFLIIISIIFIIIRQRQHKVRVSKDSTHTGEILVGSNKEVYVITLALLIAIFLTGGLDSSLYFLLYFLLFGLVFLFEPLMVFVLLLGLFVVFFPSLSLGDLTSNLIKLGSLAFLSPISFFFGREFRRREALEDEIVDKTGQILEDAETLKSHTKNEDAMDEIEDITEKAENLRKSVKE